MKKILYIAVSSEMGGVPKHILEILKRKVSSWIAVAIPDDGSSFEEIKEFSSAILTINLRPYSLKSLWHLRDFVILNNIDIIHSHGKGAGMYSRPLKILCPWVKVVHTFHGIHIDKYNMVVKKIYLSIEWFLRYMTDCFICVSESEMECALLNKIALKKRTFVVFNGVDYNRFVDIIPAADIVPENDNLYIIGCVSRMAIGKGHICLIDAFELLLNRYPDCRLVLVGDGPERKQIEDIVKEKCLGDKIIFTGIRDDIPEILAAINLFVSCSEKEGLPYTLLEALASKTAIVATDVPGNHDIITDSYNGILSKPYNHEDFCLKIAWAIEHPDICQEYESNGIKTLKQRYLVENSVEKILRIYDSLTKRSRKF